MTPDAKPPAQPHPEPLPPVEHEKAVEQEEKQQKHRRGEHDPAEGELPQTHTSVD